MALGPRATLAYRNAVRQQMIAGGMSLAEALRKCNFATIPSDALEDALNEVSNTLSISLPTLPAETVVAGEVGAGGTILAQIFAAIEAFLQSPQGQALFAALMQLLLGLIPK